MNLPEPKLEWVTDLTVHLDPIRAMGQGRAGVRRIIPIVGGTMEGPKLQGKVLNVGRIGRRFLRMVWRSWIRAMRWKPTTGRQSRS